jgi:imidazolonepropionase
VTGTLVQNVGGLYTLAGIEGRGSQAAAAMEPVAGAEVLIEDGLVQYAGPTRENRPQLARHSQLVPYPEPPEVQQVRTDLTVIDAHGALVTPGLVDPHTHALYGGNRAHEVALKLAGVPYLEILARGAGILSTVRATREASDDELYRGAATRLGAMLALGTTTVEVKSGYGLSVDEELRALRILRRLDRDLPISIAATFMGAHAVPEESRGDADSYVDLVVEQMIPAVAEERLSGFCDVFCEAGVFSVEQSGRILEAGNAHGLRGKVHADEIEPMGGAELAAAYGAISADHLRATTDEGMRRLAEAGVVPVVLPATSFNLRGNHYANARRMIDEFDLPVALATDDNPGTSPTESLQLVMTLSALELQMTPEEILAGVTINAARAIGVERQVGSLETGKEGDLVIWEAFDLAMLPYRFGANQAAIVVKGGDITASRSLRT